MHDLEIGAVIRVPTAKQMKFSRQAPELEEVTSTYKIEANMMPYTKQAPRIVRSLRNLKGMYGTGAKNLSQTPKAHRQATPKTIIAMMYPVCQPLGA